MFSKAVVEKILRLQTVGIGPDIIRIIVWLGGAETIVVVSKMWFRQSKGY
jgi:hypothetical protein